MDRISLTVEQLAQIVLLPRSKQFSLLKEHTKGMTRLEWNGAHHEWELISKE